MCTVNTIKLSNSLVDSKLALNLLIEPLNTVHYEKEQIKTSRFYCSQY